MALLSYERFRTGLKYRDVYMMLWDRPRKSRHTVLGKWREIKQAEYAEYLRRMDEIEAANDNARGDEV